MKKTLLAAGLILTIFAWGRLEFSPAHSNSSGAPTAGSLGYTGSPADAQTCARAGCHAGTATEQTGWITSDIPNTGYVAGQTYEITATVEEIGRSRFGFMLSPQDDQGNPLGTMAEGTGTQLKVNGAYITHISGSTSSNDSQSWTFDWTAPAEGTGNVTFYAAFNAANDNGNTSGDIIYTSSLEVEELLDASIGELPESYAPAVFPNPATDVMNLTYANNGMTTVELWTIDGKLAKTVLNNRSVLAGQNETFQVSDLNAGVYIMRTNTEQGSTTQRVVIR